MHVIGNPNGAIFFYPILEDKLITTAIFKINSEEEK